MSNYSHFASCLFALLLLGTQVVKAQKKPKIKGNRIVAPYNASLDAFHTIVLNEDLKINVVAADSSSVAILADDNLPPVFKFLVKDSVLIISTYYTITASKQLDITLFTPTLDSISMVSGKIGITLDPRFKSVKAYASGDTNLSVAGNIAYLSLSLDEKAFAVVNGVFDVFSLKMKDRAVATIYSDISENAQLQLSDKAGVKWGGTVAHLSAALLGSTHLDALELEATEAVVNASGSAKTELYVISHLTYFAKEESQLDLYGLPKIDLLEFSGTAQLKKKR
ncbi:MAG: DUF2807 domain-containing protein [Flavobacteriaceae bacterium]|tara:strand:+ start:11240 stop:12082 length:843 start_codon:yes stop_codon:yes gene_type:complete